MRDRDSRHFLPCIALTCLASLLTVLSIGVVLSRHASLKLSGADSVAFAQLFENMAQGKGMLSTIVPPFIEQHWFGFHFSPILYLFYPLYQAFPSIMTLNVAYSAAISFTALPLYFLLHHIAKDALQAFLCTLIFLFHPYVVNAASWDFHEIIFAPLFMIGLLWSVYEKNRIACFAMCALLICTKEHYGLSVAATGLLWWHVHRDRKFALMLITFGLISLAIILDVIMPYYNPTHAPAMLSEGASIPRYGWIRNVENWPRAFRFLLPRDIAYLMLVLLPFLFVPIKKLWWLLPASADLASILLSRADLMRHPEGYYSTSIIAIFAFTVMLSFSEAQKSRKRKLYMLLLGVLIALASSIASNPYPSADRRNTWELERFTWHVPPEMTHIFEEIDHLIPANAPVAAQTGLMSHMSPSRKIYQFPDSREPVEWIVQWINYDNQYRGMLWGMPYGTKTSKMFAAAQALVTDPAWIPVYTNQYVVVWKKAPGMARDKTKMEQVRQWILEMNHRFCRINACTREGKPIESKRII